MKFTQIYGQNIPTMCVESLDYTPWADRAVAREVPPPSWVASVGGRGPDPGTPTPPVLFSASNKLDLPATHGEGLWDIKEI